MQKQKEKKKKKKKKKKMIGYVDLRQAFDKFHLFKFPEIFTVLLWNISAQLFKSNDVVS